MISTWVEHHDERVYAPDAKPGREITEGYVSTLEETRRIRASEVLPKWCWYLMCAIALVAVGTILAGLGCDDGRRVCTDRWSGPSALAGGSALLVFTVGLWGRSAPEIDAIAAESATARAGLAAMLPTALGVLSLGIGFIAEYSDMAGGDAIEAVGWSLAAAFALATFAVRRHRKPRLLTLPAYRLPRNH